MLDIRSKRFAFLSILAPLVVLAIVASVQAKDDQPRAEKRPLHRELQSEAAEPVDVADSAPPAVEQEFEQLDDQVPQGIEDEVPGFVDGMAATAGVNVAEAQLATDSGNHPIWLAPSAEGGCLIDLPPEPDVISPAVACFDAATLLAGEAYVTIAGERGGPTELIAVVPDGATASDVIGTAGQGTIAGNVLTADLPPGSDGYVYEDGDQTVDVPVATP